MKWAFLILCLSYLTVSLEAIKRCKSADDCKEDQCCVKYTIIPYLGGVCHDLREEGKSCTPIIRKENEEEPKMHLYQCPCKEGLQCIASIEKTVFGRVVKHKPKCVAPGKENLSTVLPPEPETNPPEPDTTRPEPEPETKEPEPEPDTNEPEPDPDTDEPEPDPDTDEPEPEPEP